MRTRKEEYETPQDKEIGDRKGTQPARYHKGLAPSTKAARDRQFKKQTKMASDDPRAYKPAPGDKEAKTKPSKYTKQFKQMYGEEVKGKQLVHHGETTKNFDVCPAALKAFDQNQKDGMGDKDGFHDAVVAVDKYLGFEKALVKKGSATETDLEKMKELVSVAKGKISNAGLKGHDYHQTHIDAVKDLISDDLNEAFEESMVPQWMHKLAMTPKLKKMMRFYLDWRKKNPGQGKQGVIKAIQIMGLQPRDGNILIDYINDLIKQGKMPKHLAIQEQDDSVDRAKERHKVEKERLKTKHDREMDRARMRDTRAINREESVNFASNQALFDTVDALFEFIEQENAFLITEKSRKALKDKAEKSGISYSTLKKVYDRGVAAWRTGHRPGTTPEQWGYGRVNAFITKKKKGNLDHDKDLVKEEGGAGDQGTDVQTS